MMVMLHTNPIHPTRSLGTLNLYLFGEGPESVAAGNKAIELLQNATVQELVELLGKLPLDKPGVKERLQPILSAIPVEFDFDEHFGYLKILKPGDEVDGVEIDRFYWSVLSADQLNQFLEAGILPKSMHAHPDPIEVYDSLRDQGEFLIRLEFTQGQVGVADIVDLSCDHPYDLMLSHMDLDAICNSSAFNLDFIISFEKYMNSRAIEGIKQIAVCEPKKLSKLEMQELWAECQFSDRFLEHCPGTEMSDFLESLPNRDTSVAFWKAAKRKSKQMLKKHPAFEDHETFIEEAIEAVGEIAGSHITPTDEDWIPALLTIKYHWLEVPGPAGNYWEILAHCRNIVREITPYQLSESAMLPSSIVKVKGKSKYIVIGTYEDEVLRKAQELGTPGPVVHRSLDKIPEVSRPEALQHLEDEGIWVYSKVRRNPVADKRSVLHFLNDLREDGRLYGDSGACGVFAVALNQVVFNGNGQLYGANSAPEMPFDHVAVEFNGYLYDHNGLLYKQDLLSWTDPALIEDISYEPGVYPISEEDAIKHTNSYGVSLPEFKSVMTDIWKSAS